VLTNHVFWEMTPYRRVGPSRRFGGKWCLRLQGLKEPEGTVLGSFETSSATSWRDSSFVPLPCVSNLTAIPSWWGHLPHDLSNTPWPTWATCLSDTRKWRSFARDMTDLPVSATSKQLSDGPEPRHCISLEQQMKPLGLNANCIYCGVWCDCHLSLACRWLRRESKDSSIVQSVAWSLYQLSYPDTYSTHSKALLQTMTATQHTPSLTWKPEGSFLCSHYLATGTCPEPDESNP